MTNMPERNYQLSITCVYHLKVLLKNFPMNGHVNIGFDNLNVFVQFLEFNSLSFALGFESIGPLISEIHVMSKYRKLRSSLGFVSSKVSM
jgi:hypothetical protein